MGQLELRALSYRRHAAMRWQRFRDYHFAADQSIVPLAAAELPRAVGELPIAFAAQGESYALTAVLGRGPGENLYVGSDGRWQGRYVPAHLRGHPFYLAETGARRWVVAVDEGSGLVADEGEALFSAEGQPSQALAPVIRFLEQLARARAATERACAQLAECELLEPWPVVLPEDGGGSQRRGGLYRVRESSLGALDREKLAQLHLSGALRVAYAQLLGQQAMRRLASLARRRNDPRSGSPMPEVTAIFGEDPLEQQIDWDQLSLDEKDDFAS